jgi:hypothetical protein
MAACAVTAAKAAQCFAAKNGARHMEAEPRRAPSKSKQRRAARLCMDLYTHSTTLLSRSLSFVVMNGERVWFCGGSVGMELVQ